MEIVFLSVEDVLEIHRSQIEEFGGTNGVRDEGLLESAISQPCTTFNSTYLHGDIYEMAAAYLYHLVNNHPFIDGNKRVGLSSALIFLALNGSGIYHDEEGLFAMTIGCAKGELDKFSIADLLRGFVLSSLM